MIIAGRKIKKRYILAGVLALTLLWRCSGDDEPQPRDIEYAPQQQQVQPTPAPQQYDDAQQASAPQYVAPAPAAAPVTIVNTPSHDSNSGFFQGLLMGHLFGGNNGGGSRDSSYYHRSTKKTVVNNHYYTEPKPAPAAPKSAPARPKKPGLTTNYTTPPPTQFKTKTWATNTRKGWGAAPRTRSSGKPAFRARSRSRRR